VPAAETTPLPVAVDAAENAAGAATASVIANNAVSVASSWHDDVHNDWLLAQHAPEERVLIKALQPVSAAPTLVQSTLDEGICINSAFRVAAHSQPELRCDGCVSSKVARIKRAEVVNPHEEWI
jgi:hypothetical protein